MTEVSRCITSGGYRLIATKVYHVGDVIIDYNDNNYMIIQLAPSNEQENIELIKEFIKVTPTTSQTCFIDCICISDKNNKNKNDNIIMGNISKCKGMIQAACCYLHKVHMMTESQRKKLQSLYHPKQHYNNNESSENNNINTTTATTKETATRKNQQQPNQYESELIEMVKNSWEWMNSNMNNSIIKEKMDSNNITEQEIMNIMLIWSCNSFQGGYIYETMSRINHSCNPNCIVQTTNNENNIEKQRIIATTTIDIGNEITISYLGIYLYSDTNTRQFILQRDKYFTCHCSRCSSNIDKTRAIPCPIQHPRIMLYKLDEDDQYDDDHTVLYSYPEKVQHQQQKEQSKKKNDNDEMNDIKQNINNNDPIIQCYISTIGTVSSNDKKYSRLFEMEQNVIDKVITFIDNNNNNNNNNVKSKLTHQSQNNNKTNQKRKHKNHNRDDDDDEDHTEQEQQIFLLERHSQLASTILGTKHWTTNILSLLNLNQSLQNFHTHLLSQSLDGQQQQIDDNDIDDPITYLAECIDQLQRIYDYVNGIKDEIQYIHPGHILGDVTIGIARGLVSLGDIKSQKYANEWLLKLDDYVPYFESSSIQKVVQTLKDAWKRNDDNNISNNNDKNDDRHDNRTDNYSDDDDDKKPSSKRLKHSKEG